MKEFDLAIVGAGILGLAHAYAASKRGMRVAVFDRSPQASGASVRNFGMIWTIGQWGTPLHHVAVESNRLWRELLDHSGIWNDRCGCMTLAYHEDELAVLKEFASVANGQEVSMLDAREVLERSPSVQQDGLLGALWSGTEIHVDPRDVTSKFPDFLEKTFGVTFFWSHCITAVNDGFLSGGGQEFRAKKIVICSGDDYETLLPEMFSKSGLSRCKLQMLRATPKNRLRIGPMLCAGLTLLHYANFRNCPSLPAVSSRLEEQWPEQIKHGIHLLVSQHGCGELVLGDSHEYGKSISPFNSVHVDELMLKYLNTFLPVEALEISMRWQGVYSTNSEGQVFESTPFPNVRVVTGVGGAGMTMSMGIGERTIKSLFA